MADLTKTVDIEFIQYHLPPLEDGDYTIEVQQRVEVNGAAVAGSPFTAPTRTFTVQGPRFSLTPADIHAVFPPAGNLGDYSNVLPHIVLNRSTLPWERSPNLGSPTAPYPPWLALLLFTAAEKPQSNIITLKQLQDTKGAVFPTITPQLGQEPTDKITVIDVPQALLAEILPTVDDLPFLAHVRQATDAIGTTVGNERAVVIGNRLPQQPTSATGNISIVHLVSLEGRYASGGFDFEKPTSGDLVRLVSLKNWSFACLKETQNFEGLLENLNRTPSTLRLPENGKPNPKGYQASGYVPLPHFTQSGDQTNSWYHGPLAPGPNPPPMFTLPAPAASALVRNNSSSNGPSDVSYAAAWELGRLMALQSKKFSIAFYNWKRKHTQQLKATEQALLHLPFQSNFQLGTGSGATATAVINSSGQVTTIATDPGSGYSAAPTVLLMGGGGSGAAATTEIAGGSVTKINVTAPGSGYTTAPTVWLSTVPAVSDWFGRVSLLQGVPFNYLVPDEAMLPTESIRFFQVDPLWVDCLLDGAFSIGRVSASDHAHDAALKTGVGANPLTEVSGFLLRSAVVAGWPDLQVNGYSSQPAAPFNKPMPVTDRLNLLRMERLSPNVLICLFEGLIQTVDIHLPAEALHFGFDASTTPSTYSKELRDPTTGKETRQKITVSWLNSQRVVDINKLAGGLKAANSAQFALQMIEGVPQVRFIAGS